jgi:hypothetical protein
MKGFKDQLTDMSQTLEGWTRIMEDLTRKSEETNTRLQVMNEEMDSQYQQMSKLWTWKIMRLMGQ